MGSIIRIGAALIAILSLSPAEARHGQPTTVWNRLKIGGGGFVTDISYCKTASDFTWVTRTDVYGAYVRKSSATPWVNVLSRQSIPPNSNNSPNGALGVYDIRCAPSMPSRMYMAHPGGGTLTPQVFRSDDSGATWRVTNFNVSTFMSVVGDPHRFEGPKMQVDPNNPDVVYLGDQYGQIFRTFDGGFTWNQLTPTSFPTKITGTISTSTTAGGCVLHFGSTVAGVTVGMAVDSVRVLSVAQNGSIGSTQVVSISGGDITINSLCVVQTTSPGDQIIFSPFSPSILFDQTSGTTGGKTTKMYFGWGGGSPTLWSSTDGQVTFAAMTGGPVSTRRMVMGQDSTAWIADNTTSATGLWKLNGTTFVNVTGAVGPAGAGNTWMAASVDPANANNIVIMCDSGSTEVSFDHGATWNSFHSGAPTTISPTIPWLAWTYTGFFAGSNILHDPAGGTKVWVAGGVGPWFGVPPTDNGTLPNTWTADVVGNEEIITEQGIPLPTGGVFLTAQDRTYFRVTDPTVYPSTNGPGTQAQISILHGWDVQAASHDPNTFVAILEGGSNSKTGYSTDAGQSWNVFAAEPFGFTPGNTTQNGSIAASDSSNIVWMPAGHGPAYTTNSGASWNTSTATGFSSTNWCTGAYAGCQILISDPNAANKFWIYNPTDGLWRSTDSGANFTNVTASAGSSANQNPRISYIPGRNPTEMLLVGWQSQINSTHPNGSPMYHYVDGTGWSTVPNTQEIWEVGYGKAKPGGSYPVAIYIVGWMNVGGVSTYGQFRSDDGMATWTQIGDYPIGTTDGPTFITGDNVTYGTVYMGLSASGAVYGTLK